MIKILNIPYKPNFNNTPANIIDPPVGASTCASGNQIWKGIIGVLIANGKKKQIHNLVWIASTKIK